LPPIGKWIVWLILAGRGFGKTRAGAEWIIDGVKSGKCRQIALIGETAGDVRDTMVEVGESSIMRISPPGFMPKYEPSKRRLTWPNGAVASTFSGDEPGQLRGPAHDRVWADEPAKWKYAEDAWSNMLFGLRVGDKPQCVATTTPRPIPLIKRLLKDPTCVVTRGSTYDNLINLSPAYKGIVAQYEGTRLGLQELHAQVLDDAPGALWHREQIDSLRVTQHPELIRVVVGIDPAVTNTEESDETGIIVAGLGTDGHGYVLDDRSLRASPAGWAQEAVTAYHSRQADRILAEVNNGGDMVELTIRTIDPTVAYKSLHASRGKQTRAEPVAALYEQGRIHHVGMLATLEDQMCEWTPGEGSSPDRVDALVWCFTELMPPGEVLSIPRTSGVQRVGFRDW